MASLAETNPHLRDRKQLEQMIARSVYESSICSGASARALAKLKAEAYPALETSPKKQVS